MKKVTSIILYLIILNSIVACTSLTSEAYQNAPQWDFDHQVQFIQTEVAVNYYQLEIIQNNKVKFQQLSALLLRKSYSICGRYGYKLTMIKGVESVDYKKASPNLIRSNLVATLECPLDIKKKN